MNYPCDLIQDLLPLYYDNVCSVESKKAIEKHLFFYVSDTQWDALTTSSKVFSEYTLCSADKGADEIDAVYYFTGDDTNIESMSNRELQAVIDVSKLLWIK